ncbi:orotidine-5'-phosphate decarboxylase [Succinimonas amylolytica]|uniref:orotidine-5'-phosphate decarboxylase n=1 Tax=Succinimonas amylolytica TaxID=83769 RepID=UPI0023A7D93A
MTESATRKTDSGVKDPRIIVALDFATEREADALVARLDPARARLKIGKEMFTRFGPEMVRRYQGQGFEIFLDLKFHDIPNTVARAVAGAAELGVWMVNVHAMGGEKMMTMAAEALQEFGKDRPKLIAVTVLTSMDASQLSGVGIMDTVENEVTRLAVLARNSGLDGVVSSAREAGIIRKSIPGEFLIVTPGIRPKWAETNDQIRIVTPADALRGGSDYLVIGRPITRSQDPLEALRLISEEIEAVL